MNEQRVAKELREAAVGMRRLGMRGAAQVEATARKLASGWTLERLAAAGDQGAAAAIEAAKRTSCPVATGSEMKAPRRLERPGP